jgi:hypothetical protein
VQNMRQQQTGRAAADNRDLGARSRCHNDPNQKLNCMDWQANLAGAPRTPPAALRWRLNAAI